MSRSTLVSRRSLLLSVTAAACARRGSVGFAGYAFVANRAGKAVAAVDLSAFAVARHFRLDDEPSSVVAHPSLPVVYAITPRSGAIHEIHSGRLSAGARINIDAEPGAARFTPNGTALWILAAPQRQLIRVPSGQRAPDRRIHLPGVPTDFDLALDGSVSHRLAAVTLGDSGQIAFLDLEASRLVRSVHIGGRLGALRFRKDGRHLLIASLDDNQLLIYDAVAHRLAVRLPLAVRPDLFCMKADGGQLFITGKGMDAVVTVYPYQTEVAGTLLAGRAPGFVAVSSEPPYLFVANPQSGDVTIVNVATQKVMAVAPVGKQPCFIAVTPNSEYALVLNRDSGDMAVLHIATLAARRTKSAPLLTMIPVGSEPVSAVVRRL